MLKIFSLLRGAAAGSSPVEEFTEGQLALAVLLLEMARADFEEAPSEREFITETLLSHLRLTPEQARQLADRARTLREESLDLHQFTRQINEEGSREEKLALLEALWRLVYVDGVKDKYEEALMRRLTGLLRLSHREMIEAKLKVCKEIAGSCSQKAGCRSR